MVEQRCSVGVRKRALAFALGIVIASSANAEAEDQPTPIPARNSNPYIAIFGLPTMESGVTLSEGKDHFALLLDISNNSIRNTVADESITLDGESYRLSAIWRRGISPFFEIGMEVPYVTHSSGAFDNLIEDWHDMVGLTNNDRDDSPSNSLDYRYKQGDTTLAGFTTGNSGLGDIRLFASKSLLTSYKRSLKISASLKLPTGKENYLHGSGDTDYSIYISANDSETFSHWNISGYGQLGVIKIGQKSDIQDIRRDSALFGGLGFNWAFTQTIDLKAQLQSHTPIYNNGIDQMSHTSTLLAIGGAIRLSDTSRLDIGLVEDLVTDSIPDVTINMAFSIYY